MTNFDHYFTFYIPNLGMHALQYVIDQTKLRVLKSQSTINRYKQLDFYVI